MGKLKFAGGHRNEPFLSIGMSYGWNDVTEWWICPRKGEFFVRSKAMKLNWRCKDPFNMNRSHYGGMICSMPKMVFIQLTVICSRLSSVRDQWTMRRRIISLSVMRAFLQRLWPNECSIPTLRNAYHTIEDGGSRFDCLTFASLYRKCAWHLFRVSAMHSR